MTGDTVDVHHLINPGLGMKDITLEVMESQQDSLFGEGGLNGNQADSNTDRDKEDAGGKPTWKRFLGVNLNHIIIIGDLGLQE
jgi:hypothetical protein